MDDLLTAFLPEDFPLPRPDIVAGIDRRCLITKELKDKQGGGSSRLYSGKPDQSLKRSSQSAAFAGTRIGVPLGATWCFGGK